MAVSLIQLVVSASGSSLDPLENTKLILTRARVYFAVALLISLINLGTFLLFPRLATFQRYTKSTATNSDHPAEVAAAVAFRARVRGMRSALFPVRWLALSVMLNYLVTLALFPSITGAVTPIDGTASYAALFVPIRFVLFNLGDFVGRLLLGSEILRPKRPARLLGLCLTRVVFFLIFLTSHLDLGAIQQSLPVWVNNDFVFFGLFFVFSVSNGYVGSGSMMLAPSQSDSPDVIPLIGNVMAFFLTMGLASGSFVSFALRAVVCQCNSFMS